MTATNPFAPPQAQVLDRNQDASGLKRQSVWMTFLLIIITFGIYYVIWFFRRRPGLNRLNSPRKLELWPLLLFVALFVIDFLVALLTVGQRVPQAIGVGPALILQLARLAVGIVMLIQCFKIKDIIEDHATPDGGTTLFAEQVKLSGVMTFFFSILYLQWAINRYVVDTDASS